MPGYSSVTPSGGTAYVPEYQKRYYRKRANTKPSTLEEDTLDQKIHEAIKKYQDAGGGEFYIISQKDFERNWQQTLRAQRQSDLKKLSFHLGVDVKTLQGYLESKVSK